MDALFFAPGKEVTIMQSSIVPGLFEDQSENILASLKKLDASADVMAYQDCCGTRWYEWWIGDDQGLSPTFSEAVRDMYTQKLENLLW